MTVPEPHIGPMPQTETTTPSSEDFEYMTYAPKGAMCSACDELIKPMELTRRSSIGSPSGAPISAYRHAPVCPEREQEARVVLRHVRGSPCHLV